MTTEVNTCEVLHQNDTYTVIPYSNFDNEGVFKRITYPFATGENVFYQAGYLVTNKTTNVVEFTSISLPEAIHAAEQMNDTLLSAPWKWFAVRRKAMEEGKIPDENKVYLETMEKQYARKARPAGASEELVK